MNPDLKQQRIDLACALRWAARLSLHEGVDNHFSLAVPDEDGVMRGNRSLINPYGWHWSEVTASSLVLCNDKGEVLEGNNEAEDTAFFIHSRIHMGAPHAICVLHTHMPYATSITLLKEPRSPPYPVFLCNTTLAPSELAIFTVSSVLKLSIISTFPYLLTFLITLLMRGSSLKVKTTKVIFSSIFDIFLAFLKISFVKSP